MHSISLIMLAASRRICTWVAITTNAAEEAAATAPQPHHLNQCEAIPMDVTSNSTNRRVLYPPTPLRPFRQLWGNFTAAPRLQSGPVTIAIRTMRAAHGDE